MGPLATTAAALRMHTAQVFGNLLHYNITATAESVRQLPFKFESMLPIGCQCDIAKVIVAQNFFSFACEQHTKLSVAYRVHSAT